MTTEHPPHPSPLGSNGASRFELPVLQPLTYSTFADDNDVPQQSQPTPPASVTPSSSRFEPSPYHQSTSMPGAFPSSPAPEESPLPALPASPSPVNSRKASGSVRRFLSLKALNSSPNNNESADLSGSPYERRPSSPSSASTASRPSLGKKNPGSWFRRKSSLKLDEAVKANKEYIAEEESNAADLLPPTPPPKSTSPPPQLPELKSIDDGGTLGADDLFRDIK